MKDIIEYDGELYLVNDMINFSKYGSEVKICYTYVLKLLAYLRR